MLLLLLGLLLLHLVIFLPIPPSPPSLPVLLVRFLFGVLLGTIHCVPKKEATKLLAITFSNVNQFSKFFHC